MRYVTQWSQYLGGEYEEADSAAQLQGTQLTGEVVLDPFSGSGTTGVVAAQSSRRAILVELNPVYAQQSQARINQDLETDQPRSDTIIL